MMKKRIVALLLAGLMTTTALASCRAQNSNNPNGTEPNQTTASNPQNTTNPNDPNNVPTDKWEDVGASVYTYKNVTLRKEANSTSTALASIPKETELLCIKQNKTWYFVEYDGEEGYILKSSATTINFLPTDFVPLEGGPKVMYANAKTINVRPYPIANDTIAKAVGSYSLNDEVTVVAQNNNWYRVKFIDKNKVEHLYYVHSSCLSDTKGEDPNIVPADELFTVVADNVQSAPTMYVYGVTHANVRKAPNINADELLTLDKGDAVKILRTIVIDGKEWMHVGVEIAPQRPEDDVIYKYGYISSDCLAHTNGDMTIEDLLNIYTDFTAKEQTMYILQDSSIFIRSAPAFNDENILFSPKSGTNLTDIKTIKVLAEGIVKDEGTQKDYTWYIVECTQKEGTTEKIVRGFVGGKALDVLTTDPSGKPTVTLEGLLNDYPNQFTILETPVTVTTKSEANCYGTPSTEETPLTKLNTNTTITLVATAKGYDTTWAVIQTSEGAYYFVFYSKLNQAAE